MSPASTYSPRAHTLHGMILYSIIYNYIYLIILYNYVIPNMILDVKAET